MYQCRSSVSLSATRGGRLLNNTRDFRSEYRDRTRQTGGSRKARGGLAWIGLDAFCRWSGDDEMTYGREVGMVPFSCESRARRTRQLSDERPGEAPETKLRRSESRQRWLSDPPPK
jgi:hypothetical protein